MRTTTSSLRPFTPPRATFSLLVAATVALAALLISFFPITQLVLLAGAITASLLLIRRAWFIWPIIAAILPFAAAIRFGPASALDLLLFAALALWFADGVRRRSLQLTHSAIALAALLYLATLALSTLGAVDLDEAFREMIKWLEFVAVLLIAPSMLSPSHARWVVAALLVAAAAQAVLGLYQFVFRIGPEWFVLFDRFMRASGTFAQPNPYAGYLGLTLPIAVILALAAWAAFTLRSGRKLEAVTVGLFASTAAALTAAGMLASWSRGAWLGAIAAMIVVIFGRSRRMILLGTALAAIVAAFVMLGAVAPDILPESLAVRVFDLPGLFGLGNVLQQPLTDENFAVVERVAHWVAALRMWESALWLGVGPGNYAALYESVRLPLWEEPLGHAHNIYLNTLAEGGLLGLGALLLLWGTVIHRAIVTIKAHWSSPHTGMDWPVAVAFGVLGVVAHLAVHSLFDSLFVQGMIVHLAMWIAVLIALTSQPGLQAGSASLDIGTGNR